MNKQINKLFLCIIVLFATLGVSTTIIQSFMDGQLSNNAHNIRSLYNEFNKPRGEIIASGKTIAYSKKSNDAYGYQRYYNNGELYSAVTGFFSVGNIADRGIEAAMDKELNGESNTQWLARLQSLLTGSDNSGSVILTIDDKLQKLAFDELGNHKGAVIALDPKTGAIKAMVSKPAYDPNVLAVHDAKKASETFRALAKNSDTPLINRTVAALYPPGSTAKIITASAAMQSGKYEPDTLVPAPQFYTLPGTKTELPNFGNEICSPTNEQSISDAVRMSCNTAFAGLGVKLGKKAMWQQAENFGVDHSFVLAGTNNAGFPFSVVKSAFPKEPTDDRLALASIGQGDASFTVLQDALLSAAVANEGKLMTPYIVDEVQDSHLNVVFKTKASMFKESISKESADKMRQMMERVFQNGGSAYNAQLPDIQLAGKTGTAQTTNDQAPHAWVTAFGPSVDARLVVAVLIENGENLTGGSAAAPIAKALFDDYLHRKE